MLRFRRRRVGENEGKTYHSIPSPVLSSLGSTAQGFVGAVMNLQYKPKISLRDVARAERVFIGEGHSFRVEKAFIESADGIPRLIAMKHPLFSKGDNSRGGHWNRLLLEVKSLMHPHLAAHPNIVDLLAIGWESGISETNPELEWPVLVMPYAAFGTLDTFQWSTGLDSDGKINLCLDIASGLRVLHQCGIVHGDLKSENVLIFAEDSGPVAKLCDFGFSVIDPQAFGKLLGGSEPWNCPEWKDTILKENLPLTDVYSFGLLFWRTVSKCSKPFEGLPFFANDSYLTANDIDRLKRSPNDLFLQEIKRSRESTCIGSTKINLFEQILDHTIRLDPRLRSLEEAISKLDELLAVEGKEQKRRIDRAFPIISPDQVQVQGSFDARAARSISWQHQVSLFEYHLTLVTSSARELTQTEIMESNLFLFFSYLLGVGTKEDKSVACQYLLRSAEAGDSAARAIAYRSLCAFSQPLPASIKPKDITKWLCRSIEMGCISAKNDFLHLIGKHEATTVTLKRWYDVAINRLRCFTAGVGAGHFLDAEGSRLNPFSIEDQNKFQDEIIRHINEKNLDANKFILNSREDLLLHFVSTCGFTKALRFLTQYLAPFLDINAVNKDGETALLSASRAGQTETVRILLGNGADLRPSVSGENPLHWLCVFDPDDIPDLARQMVQKPSLAATGLDCTEGKRCSIHQKASATKWSNFWDSELPAGTPMHRAVHFKNLEAVRSLLDLGADPQEPGLSDSGISAIELACFQHQESIVKIMLDKLGILDVSKIKGRPLIHLALSCYDDLTSLVVNGGSMQLNQLKTVLLLMDRGANTGLVNTGVPGSDDMSTALFEAVLSKSHLSVKVALSGLLLKSPDLLNVRCGENFLSPLHVAVKNGAIHIVESLLEAGVDPTIPSGSGDFTTLHYCAAMDSSSPHTCRILNLISPFFDTIDQSYDGGETPFVLAVRLLKFDLALALLEKGANINFEFSKGDDDLIIKEPTTILGFLLQQLNPGGLSAVQFLLGYDRKGRKNPGWKYPLPSPIVNREHGVTVFHTIAMRRRKPLYAINIIKEMMTYISEAYGDDLNLVNQQCTFDVRPTALHIAAHSTNIEVVTSLLRLGADQNAVDHHDDEMKPVENARSVMIEDFDIDEEQGWTEATVRREIERRKEVYEILGGNMDIFETADPDNLALFSVAP